MCPGREGVAGKGAVQQFVFESSSSSSSLYTYYIIRGGNTCIQLTE